MGLQEVLSDIDLFDNAFPDNICTRGCAAIHPHVSSLPSTQTQMQQSYRDAPRLLRKDLSRRKGSCHTNPGVLMAAAFYFSNLYRQWWNLNFRPGIIVVQHDQQALTQNLSDDCLYKTDDCRLDI